MCAWVRDWRKNLPLIPRVVDEDESRTSPTRLAARYAVGKGNGATAHQGDLRCYAQ
jgi:hypothetical protein